MFDSQHILTQPQNLNQSLEMEEGEEEEEE